MNQDRSELMRVSSVASEWSSQGPAIGAVGCSAGGDSGLDTSRHADRAYCAP
jgi:hypothetical protein